jgi:DNA-binding NarL/FixJ family response regulator
VIRVLIVDDHAVFARGLEEVFRAQPDFAPLPALVHPGPVVGVVTSQRPDAVIMDVRLGDMSGIDLTKRLRSLPVPPAVVIVTAFADPVIAVRAVIAGAAGFLAKSEPAERVVSAVRAATSGWTWFPEGLLGTAISEVAGDPAAGPLPGPATVHARPGRQGRRGLLLHPGQRRALTEREREVLQLMVCGLDRRAVAGRLYMSPDTVRTHVRNICAKLGARGAVEAVALALQAGLRPE